MLSRYSTITLATLASTTLAVNPIIRQGSNFVDSKTGDRFEILGVAYQPGANAGFKPGSGQDPLTDSKACLRDAIAMQQLGINAIRTYNVDPTANHDDCASIFNAAGIYMMIDVNTPQISLNAEEPWTTYTGAYLDHIFQVVEAFAPYDNLLAFVSANEVINDGPTGKVSPPYVKAVTRDLKNYIANHVSRPIPVGYAAAQIQDTILDQWNFFRCTTTGQSNDPSITDFFALNSYSWCGQSSYKTSGYDKLVGWFGASNTPMIFGEYGCNTFTGAVNGGPRPFTEVQELYGPNMLPVFSGGNVFEWTMETNDYGLVIVNSDKSISLRQDYVNLQNNFNKLNWAQVTASNGTATALPAPKCDKSLITEGLNNNFTLPSPPDNGTDMIKNGVKLQNKAALQPWSQTALPYQVKNVQGASQSWSLKILSQDQSNAPSGNTAGGAGNGTTIGGTSSSSSSYAVPTAMPKVAGVLAGAAMMGAMIL